VIISVIILLSFSLKILSQMFIRLYFIENGLETVRKKFDEIDEIYLLEFIDYDEKLLVIGTKSREKRLKLITWDPFNTGKVEVEVKLDNFLTIENLGARLARTSGNLLQVDDKGKVTSILKKIEKVKNELKPKNPDKIKYSNIELCEKMNDNHIIHFDKKNENFKPIVDEKEPWVIDDYERHSYCLYNNNQETLQLIVGRSTVQIWHQIHSDSNDKKKDLPNEGKPFLEYIWTNGIPINQERNETRLRVEVEELKFISDDGEDGIVHLKVCWFERSIANEKKKNKNKDEKIRMENEIIKEMEKVKERESSKVTRKEKEIILRFQKKGINEKIGAVRHACKALQHLNKRKKFLANNYVKTHQVSCFFF
jgi:hypothetical protein